MLSDMPYAVIEKNRDINTGQVEMAGITGEVTHRALIVDDMISSGKTIVKAADLLAEKGAEEIYVFATHPIFSDEAPSLLEASYVTKVFVADTVFIPESKKFSKLEILSVAPGISKEIPTSVV
jgi:ribose-phosphate pyrophosphokinase